MKLVIKDLKLAISGKDVVNGVSLSVNSGEKHVIMGPNGSGKSSLANALAGHPSYSIISGSVKLGKVNLLDLSPDERTKAGLMLAFQYPIEVPGLTVWQFLWQAYQDRFASSQPKSGKKIAQPLGFIHFLEKMTGQVALPESVLKRGLNEGFSGGEKKKLELLQLLVLEPSFAIFDETDSGLDIDAVKVVAQGIEFLSTKYKVGCLIITHYQRLLQYVVPNFTHIMVAGHLVEQGGSELVQKVERDGYKQYKVR